MHISCLRPRMDHKIAIHNRLTAVLFASTMALWLTILPQLANAIDEKWKAEMIADALLAAPPSVTHNAMIYAWKR